MILRFLLDYGDAPNVKCVYIAPFRTLASEIEETLSSSFSLIPNAKVSKFYGGYEADLLDQPDVEQSRVLIVTPEKLDGMLRQNPKLVSQIRLIIVDEGHLIGDATERGRKYQTLLQRLIYALKIKREKSERQSTRLLFISGVLPDVQNFADWLTGDRNNIVETSWRPTDEPYLPGVLRWDGKEFIRSDTGQSICLPPIASHSQQNSEMIKAVRTAHLSRPSHELPLPSQAWHLHCFSLLARDI
jgi:replicative superfamily II helicase